MNCSFQPKISTNSKILAGEKKQQGKLEDKLYQEAFDKMEKIENLKLRKAEEEINHLTFQPKINDKHNIQFKDKVEERYKEVKRFKEDMISRLREKYDMEKDMTFKPKISEISDRVASLKYKGKDVVERLRDHGNNLKQKKIEMADEVNQKIARECSFHPNVNFEGNDQVRNDLKNYSIFFFNLFSSLHKNFLKKFFRF